ncbi:MAG TPA: hypothetical protein VJS45_03920 [Acidimicrobiia bacterium]|nr:hypothetical protein [Acidimicrobiia bacterium]
MSQHRRAVTRLTATSRTRRSRLLIGSVAALGASGLILGGIGVPVSAGDVNAVGNPYASAEVQDGCVTAAAGTGGANGSVVPQQGSDPTVEATGEGTATVTVCREDLDGALPDDPGGSLPDDPGGIVADELDDIVPGEPGGSLEGEVVAIVTATLDGLPGGGDGSLPGDLLDGLDGIVPDGGSFPGDPGDLPEGLGGLVPDGSGIDAGDLFDRLAEIIPGAGNGGGPGGNGGNGNGGNGGGAPAVNTSTNGSVSGSVVGGIDAERPDPTDAVLGTEVGGGAPALVGTSVSPGGTLPRTGGGLGVGVLRLIAFLGLGRGLAGLAKRR